VLRDDGMSYDGMSYDGMSYGDYVEQLTYLLFLKMADERSKPPWNQPSPITKGFDWPSLLAKDGDEKAMRLGFFNQGQFGCVREHGLTHK